ncbi:ptype atpase [Plasmopara halstedii]|uniref:Ptype atpase n=1 Tax=Plasmopara halstedii TaxID=4781 RepID=A0A0P1ACU4_PLAHL|nr:ptype atpase [Plasmopara halstedii]CEG38317.1 ptype atpase [Plasmopara halstedii]|eukprot:XP_024574686.1 ptype atpase [Plasmopara halstedii]
MNCETKSTIKSKAAEAKAVIFISDDEHDKSKPCTSARPIVSFGPSSTIINSGSDSDVEPCFERSLKSTAKSSPRPSCTTNSNKRSFTYQYTSEKVPEQKSKRHASSKIPEANHSPPIYQTGGLKPITPSSAIKSSMNASLVFDMVTSLSTNDPGAAIATLRSVVVLGREYPSDLLYAELIDRIQSHEAIAYNDAVAIYGALVFVFDKAVSCSCAPTFPNQWEPLATALQEVSGNGRVGIDGKPQKDEHWRRNLLVVQFLIYCFQQDMFACRLRYERLEGKAWLFHTRLFALLQSDLTTLGSAKARSKSRIKSTKMRNNNLIFCAIGWGLQLWKRVYDDEDHEKKKKVKNSEKDNKSSLFLRQEGEQACLSVIRLIEMLYMCTDQHMNALQRVQVGLGELKRPTRIKFAQSLQLPALRTQLSSTMIGLSNKSRNTETEWYECNALGRVELAMSSNYNSDLTHTDGYSWSHFDSFLGLEPQNNLTDLLQEISRMQHQ